MLAGYTMGMEPSGRELLVVAIKGTFRVPTENDAALLLHEEQVPLVMSDVFYGEPGLSAPKYEVDFAPHKQSCDVLLNATAYSPDGRPAHRVEVTAEIGSWSKSFAVVGDRVWNAAGAGFDITSPIAFTSMPINYDLAFGGTNTRDVDPAKHSAFMANPSGRGFYPHMVKDWIHGMPLPNTEESGQPVNWMEGKFKPMSFGPLGRHWEPRRLFAGTYDQTWRDEVFPFLPADFDERHYQSAPIDQQIATPSGEQRIRLTNLTPDGMRSFVLPHFEAPVHFFAKRGGREDFNATLDTIVIEPDEARLTMTWRATRPLKKNMFEVAQVLVGQKGRDWWQKQEETFVPMSTLAEQGAGA
jgi:hypothetical protein